VNVCALRFDELTRVFEYQGAPFPVVAEWLLEILTIWIPSEKLIQSDSPEASVLVIVTGEVAGVKLYEIACELAWPAESRIVTVIVPDPGDEGLPVTHAVFPSHPRLMPAGMPDADGDFPPQPPLE
jgi:hypothetical protein